MPLDDLDLPQSTKNKPTRNRFFRSGTVLLSFGIFISFVLLLFFSVDDENPFKDPFVYFPIIIGLIPFFFSFIYSYFENNVNEPLKKGWEKIHFYLTIIPLYFIQLFGIVYFHHLYMNRVNPFVATLSPISLFWLIVFIGQIFFLSNIFRSLKLSFYKEATFHPTHYLFFFVAIFFLIKSSFIYFFGGNNTTWDLQLHDTYFVTTIFQINFFFTFLFLFFGGIYYFLNKNLTRTLNPLLSKIHFFFMILAILYFSLFFINYDNSIRRYYSSTEAMMLYQEAITLQWTILMGSFLIAQFFFLINLLGSVLLSVFSKK